MPMPEQTLESQCGPTDVQSLPSSKNSEGLNAIVFQVSSRVYREVRIRASELAD
jgi:hypothetical protein